MASLLNVGHHTVLYCSDRTKDCRMTTKSLKNLRISLEPNGMAQHGPWREPLGDLQDALVVLSYCRCSWKLESWAHRVLQFLGWRDGQMVICILSSPLHILWREARNYQKTSVRRVSQFQVPWILFLKHKPSEYQLDQEWQLQVIQLEDLLKSEPWLARNHPCAAGSKSSSSSPSFGPGSTLSSPSTRSDCLGVVVSYPAAGSTFLSIFLSRKATLNCSS